jgi:hypothetical protein
MYNKILILTIIVGVAICGLETVNIFINCSKHPHTLLLSQSILMERMLVILLLTCLVILYQRQLRTLLHCVMVTNKSMD